MKKICLLASLLTVAYCGCGPDTSVTLPDKPNTEPVPVVTEDAGGKSQSNVLKPRK